MEKFSTGRRIEKRRRVQGATDLTSTGLQNKSSNVSTTHSVLAAWAPPSAATSTAAVAIAGPNICVVFQR
jgi:hypothetical protein